MYLKIEGPLSEFTVISGDGDELRTSLQRGLSGAAGRRIIREEEQRVMDPSYTPWRDLYRLEAPGDRNSA
jgi:hypothetical protein